MRNLVVGLLLVGFFPVQAIAENEISADLVFEHICEDSGYQKGSDEFDQCMKNSRNSEAAQESKNSSAVPKSDTQKISGTGESSAVSEEKNSGHGATATSVPAAQPATNDKGTSQSFCENYGYTKGSPEYQECLVFAGENGYSGDGAKIQNPDGQASFQGIPQNNNAVHKKERN